LALRGCDSDISELDRRVHGFARRIANYALFGAGFAPRLTSVRQKNRPFSARRVRASARTLLFI
jgi:hypothetical protein